MVGDGDHYRPSSPFAQLVFLRRLYRPTTAEPAPRHLQQCHWAPLTSWRLPERTRPHRHQPGLNAAAAPSSRRPFGRALPQSLAEAARETSGATGMTLWHHSKPTAKRAAKRFAWQASALVNGRASDSAALSTELWAAHCWSTAGADLLNWGQRS